MIHKVRWHFLYSFICKFTKESSSENIYQIGQELTELWSWVCGPVLLAHPVYTTSSVQRSASMLWSEDEVGRCVAASVVFWKAIFYRRQSVVYHQWHPVRTAVRIANMAKSSIDSSWWRIRAWPTVILRPTIIWYSVTHSLFHSRLKTFLFCKSFPLQPFLFLLQD